MAGRGCDLSKVVNENMWWQQDSKLGSLTPKVCPFWHTWPMSCSSKSQTTSVPTQIQSKRSPRWDGPARGHSLLTAMPPSPPQALWAGAPSPALSLRSAVQLQPTFLLCFWDFGIQIPALLGSTGLRWYITVHGKPTVLV